MKLKARAVICRSATVISPFAGSASRTLSRPRTKGRCVKIEPPRFSGCVDAGTQQSPLVLLDWRVRNDWIMPVQLTKYTGFETHRP